MGAELRDDVDVADDEEWTPAERSRRHLIGVARSWISFVGFGRIGGAFGAALVVAGVGWWLLRAPEIATESRLPLAEAPADGTIGGPPSDRPTSSIALPSTTVKRFVVHVTGAVQSPGVYELDVGQRVADAIVAAGGALADGDPNSLNLAAPIADGDRIAVPSLDESTGDVDVVDAGHTHAVSTPADALEPVDINAADEALLESLPGVGPATAAAIVEHRDANGPFATIDDLEAVRGIGPAKIEAIRDFVTV